MLITGSNYTHALQ